MKRKPARYNDYASKKHRKQDERFLGWLNSRWQGVTCKAIAAADGDVSDTYVRAATNRVRAEDAKHHADVLVFG